MEMIKVKIENPNEISKHVFIIIILGISYAN